MKANKVNKKVINISIITLSKNDYKNFNRTLRSINSQKIRFNIEWLIIDGSDYKINRKINHLLNKYFSGVNKRYISLKHINSKSIGINGIYPCMNYGKKIAKGIFIIYLNSGDTFYTNYSLNILMKKTIDVNPKSSLIFGQAKIIASRKLSWLFPGEKLTSIKKWLSIFEPNHQSMLISKSLANYYEFSQKYNLISDGYWKRKVINAANEIVYINKPVIKFYLDGISSKKPTKKIILDICFKKEISLIRKIIFLVKYFFPENLFFLYQKMQKYKSSIVDLIF
tara:strand:+ start:613 stop:1458 length:846 start_codon:yes stop_codon:yes gene_type:complete